MPFAPRRHQFALRFDRTVCRDCGRDAADAGPECKGARKVRPRAGFRSDEVIKPDFSRWPQLAKAWKQYQIDRGRA